MTKTMAIHSYKGGTGKTYIAANLAAIYAQKGKNVCLLDVDFRAPSLHTLFDVEDIKYWFNDYLLGVCDFPDLLVDLTKKYNTKGNLQLGFSNPSTEAIRDIISRDKTWEMLALRKMLLAKDMLSKEMGSDYIIFDTSPGVLYSSVNAVMASDVTILVMKDDDFDIKGTEHMIAGIYEVLQKPVGLVINKIPPLIYVSEYAKKSLLERFEKAFEKPVLSLIMCNCDVLVSRAEYIFAFEKPSHEFTRSLEQLAEKLEKF